MVRVFENLMSRNDEMKVWSSPGLETHLFLSHVDCISSIMMTQIKKYFFAIFNLCPILTCPGMTKHYGHLGFGHNMFYIFLFGTEIICPSYPLSDQISFFLFKMVSKTGDERQREYYANNQGPTGTRYPPAT